MSLLSIPNIKEYNNRMFFMIAGPCVVEGRDITFQIAEHLKSLTERYRIPFIFKGFSRQKARPEMRSSKRGEMGYAFLPRFTGL